MRLTSYRRRSGFTLIEALVVITIVLVMIVLLIPAVQRVRESACRVHCQHNMRTLSNAIKAFEIQNKAFPTYHGIFPPVYDPATKDFSVKPEANRTSVYGSWFVHLMPFVEQGSLYQKMQDSVQAAQWNEDKLVDKYIPGTIVSPEVPEVKETYTVRVPGYVIPGYTIPGTPAVPYQPSYTYTPPYVPGFPGSPAEPAIPPTPGIPGRPAFCGYPVWVTDTDYNGFTIHRVEWRGGYAAVPGIPGRQGTPYKPAMPPTPGYQPPNVTVPAVPFKPAVDPVTVGAVQVPDKLENREKLVKAKQPAKYEPANAGPYKGHIDIWMEGVHDYQFWLLFCYMDPTWIWGWYGDYLGYLWYWAFISYMINWHAVTQSGYSSGDSEYQGKSNQKGVWSPPSNSADLTDGAENTVLFAEGYARCDQTDRIALYAKDSHNFGVTWAKGPGEVVAEWTCSDHSNIIQGSPGSCPTCGKSLIPREGLGYGAIVPSDDPSVAVPATRKNGGLPNTFKFQVQPKPKKRTDCPTGEECCNSWTAQTPHRVMIAAFADGSVRSIDKNISQKTWNQLMLPRDGSGNYPMLPPDGLPPCCGEDLH